MRPVEPELNEVGPRYDDDREEMDRAALEPVEKLPECEDCGEPTEPDDLDERGRCRGCAPQEHEPPAWEDLD